MLWLDMGLCSVCLWGGVSGYLAGWRKIFRRLALLVAAAATAAIFQSDMRLFITLHYPVDFAVRTLIINRSAIPVGSTVAYPEAVLNSLEVPAWMHPFLVEKAAAVAAVSATGVIDVLTMVTVNALSFAAGFALWGGAFHLAVFFKQNHSNVLPSYWEQWVGAIIGIIFYLWIYILVAGATAPLFWLVPISRDLFNPEQAYLFNKVLQLFNYTGIWWH